MLLAPIAAKRDEVNRAFEIIAASDLPSHRETKHYVT